jgi:energy-coupling factor transporter ATP-binding protein EcfA2
MPMNELRVSNLNYKMLKNVDFSLRQGEVSALMGPNGSGKTTLARLIAGYTEPTDGEINLIKNGVNIPWSKVKHWQEIGIVGQHPRRQTIGATIAEELGFGLLNLGYKANETMKMVRKMAQQIGLENRLSQSPAVLSGGERQKLVIASILGLNPSFLILDEAFAMLDERSQERCLELLISPDKKIGQLWITHDPELAAKADRLLVLKDGSLLDLGKPAGILEDIHICRKFAIRSTMASETPAGREEKIWEKCRLMKGKTTRPEVVPKTEGENAATVLEWKNAQYDSRLTITQAVKINEFIAVVGPSGAGKSTLLESVIALSRPSDGQFLAFGREITAFQMSRHRKKVRLIIQEPGEYQIGRNVYHEVFYLQGRRERKDNRAENLQYLEIFGIPARLAFEPQENLSGGERQKVALAAALECLPEVLLLDEPLLGLDADGRRQVQSLIGELKGKLSILYVTHDLSEVLGLADRIWLLEKGELGLDCQGKDWHRYRARFQKAGVRFPANRHATEKTQSLQ